MLWRLLEKSWRDERERPPISLLRAQLERDGGVSGAATIVGSYFLSISRWRPSNLHSSRADDDTTPLSLVCGTDPGLQALLKQAQELILSVESTVAPQLERWEADLIDLLREGKAGVRTVLGSEKAQKFADRLDAVGLLVNDRIESSDHGPRLSITKICPNKKETGI